MTDNQSNPIDRQRGIRNTVIVLSGVILLVVGLIVNKVTTPHVLTQEDLRAQNAIVFDKPRMFTDFELLNEEKQIFSKEQLKGKWSIIFFGFTHCPDICPVTLMDLSRWLPSLPEDIAKDTQIILVSLDPARDTPDVLKEYVSYFNKDFIGVTGDFLTIRKFANEVNVAFAKVTQGDDYTVDHSGNLVLINPKGDYHGFFKPPFDDKKLTLAFTSIYRAF